jgi:hypothetical protein
MDMSDSSKKKEPKGGVKWSVNGSPTGLVFQLTIRATGQLVGLVLRLYPGDGSIVHEGHVWDGRQWMYVGPYSKWINAKRAVQSAHKALRENHD